MLSQVNVVIASLQQSLSQLFVHRTGWHETTRFVAVASVVQCMAAKWLQQDAFQSVASESTRVSLRTGNNVL